ncbi:MAG: hypothetical protein WHX60_08475 [Armatimonadota bacterium]
MKAPIEWFCWDYEDNQVKDALNLLRQRKELEQQNGYLLRVLLWVMGFTWAAVILRSVIAWRW